MVIDATSEGYILKTFYKKYKFGRPVDNKTAPYSVISNYVWNDIRCGVNKDAGHVNQYDKEDFSKKLLLSHKDAQETIKKDNFLSLAQVLGVREGISFMGEETLDYSNILLQRQPKKPLFYAFSDLDRHGNDRLGDKSDVSTLESIVFDKKEIEREIYHTLEPNYLYYKLNDRNFVFYDMWTHASASLVKIYKREKLDVKSLNKRFIDVYNEGFIAKTVAPNQQSHQPSYAEIENFILHLIKKTSK